MIESMIQHVGPFFDNKPLFQQHLQVEAKLGIYFGFFYSKK